MRVRLKLNQSGMKRLVEFLKGETIAKELSDVVEPAPRKKKAKRVKRP
jgi:hypothetical protein